VRAGRPQPGCRLGLTAWGAEHLAPVVVVDLEDFGQVGIAGVGALEQRTRGRPTPGRAAWTRSARRVSPRAPIERGQGRVQLPAVQVRPWLQVPLP
jgi:hypothetical protein